MGAANDYAQSVIQQADGKLVVAGYSWNGSNDDVALVRYNEDGSLDTSFDGDGKVTTAIGAGDDYGRSVIQQADGKLVVAGYSENGGNYDFALVRCESSGQLTTTANLWLKNSRLRWVLATMTTVGMLNTSTTPIAAVGRCLTLPLMRWMWR
ncbi:MAG: delta-60 repeat domain-containing protein [Pseudomonadales bacterium]